MFDCLYYNAPQCCEFCLLLFCWAVAVQSRKAKIEQVSEWFFIFFPSVCVAIFEYNLNLLPNLRGNQEKNDKNNKFALCHPWTLSQATLIWVGAHCVLPFYDDHEPLLFFTIINFCALLSGLTQRSSGQPECNPGRVQGECTNFSVPCCQYVFKLRINSSSGSGCYWSSPSSSA